MSSNYVCCSICGFIHDSTGCPSAGSQRLSDCQLEAKSVSKIDNVELLRLYTMGEIPSEDITGQAIGAEVLRRIEVTDLNALRDECHRTAVEHGFWDEPKHDAVYIALMHSELSEALEELRTECPDKIDNAGLELADCIIRIFDYCGAKGIDIDSLLRSKMEYNRTRPMRHGKEF